jgi:hypothetical protein
MRSHCVVGFGKEFFEVEIISSNQKLKDLTFPSRYWSKLLGDVCDKLLGDSFIDFIGRNYLFLEDLLCFLINLITICKVLHGFCKVTQLLKMVPLEIFKGLRSGFPILPLTLTPGLLFLLLNLTHNVIYEMK